jgi:hypothetical protein
VLARVVERRGSPKPGSGSAVRIICASRVADMASCIEILAPTLCAARDVFEQPALYLQLLRDQS